MVGSVFMDKDNCRERQLFNGEIPSLPGNTVVAMAYIPYQNPVMIYTAEQGLSKGTLFPCLDKPFLCGGYRR